MAHGSRKQGAEFLPLQAPGRERPSSPAFSTEGEKRQGRRGMPFFRSMPFMGHPGKTEAPIEPSFPFLPHFTNIQIAGIPGGGILT
ncbi:hypothetical protein CXU05_07965 [Akkermansia muciniphila]|nr:hypothetical protein CXU05_07965 [Akkermansia muciniphila]